MVHTMAYDPWSRWRVASLVALIGCGPTVHPEAPGPGPGGFRPVAHQTAAVAGGRQVVVGEMCPQGVAGRPGIAPLVARQVQWGDAAADLSALVERGSAPRFVVFGVDGKQAGVFDTMGTADIGLPQAAAAGAYTGASPCTRDDGAGAGAAGDHRVEDPRCGQATSGCGLAVAAIVRPDDPAQAPAYTTGGACLSGDALAIDVDGDGKPESFPLADLLDGVRGPAAEWSASAEAAAVCAPSFTLYGVALKPEAEGGKPADPKYTVTLDVLGVLDLDGDGRREVVLALRFATVRTVVVYAATGSPGRLELVGEAPSFPR
jgi:hypothetical protein